jgi:hypothetical protein
MYGMVGIPSTAAPYIVEAREKQTLQTLFERCTGHTRKIIISIFCSYQRKANDRLSIDDLDHLPVEGEL